MTLSAPNNPVEARGKASKRAVKPTCGNAALLPQHRYNADIRGSIKSTLLRWHPTLSGISVVVERTRVWSLPEF